MKKVLFILSLISFTIAAHGQSNHGQNFEVNSEQYDGDGTKSETVDFETPIALVAARCTVSTHSLSPYTFAEVSIAATDDSGNGLYLLSNNDGPKQETYSDLAQRPYTITITANDGVARVEASWVE